MSVNSLSASVTPAAPSAPESPRPKDLAGAARQFEALLLTQMLRTARESSASDSEGWMGSGSDSAANTAIEMAEEQFANALAAQGGLGLAKMVTSTMPEP
jgi:Rod binding domain-containing protein